MHVKCTDGVVDTYPYSIGQLRRENPNTSFPKIIPDAVLQDWGVYPVTISDQPTYTRHTQTLLQNEQPTLVNNEWKIGWTLINKTSDEITEYDNSVSAYTRVVRDKKLAETDWWALSDLTMSAEQTAYRQALRDITSHANWPHLDEADWPTKP